MRTRNGFVSNSSTTSFIIIGWKYDGEKDPIFKKIFKYAMERNYTKDDECIDLQEEANEKNISIAVSYDHEIIGIGIKNRGDGCVNSIEPQELFDIIKEFEKFNEQLQITKKVEVFYGSGSEM